MSLSRLLAHAQESRLFWARLMAVTMPLFVIWGAWTSGAPLLLWGGLSAVLAVVAFIPLPGRPTLEATIIAICLGGVGMAFTASMAGHPWQIDSHMLYFVILAVVATMQSLVALITACAVVALHHLGLSVALPALVYPTADVIVNIQRTVLHGLIVVIEGGILAAVILTRQKLEREDAELRERQVAALAEASEARADAMAKQAEAQAAVEALGAGLRRLAEQDFSVPISDALPGGYDVLRLDYNSSLDALNIALGDVRSHSDVMASRTTQSKSLTNEIAGRISEQSRQLGQAAQTSKTLAEVLGSDAARVIDVSKSSQLAAKTAGEGCGVVKEAVEAMERISGSSKAIESIIDVIEEIAFQTNLLALNAGVEAARAGDHGRGFAVVASEVRALAMRTSNAAGEVKSLITDSTAHVADGARLVGEGGEALALIDTQVNEAAGLMDRLATDIRERAQSLSGMRDALDQIDGDLAGMVETASDLNAHSDMLANAVADIVHDVVSFELSDGGAAAAGSERGPIANAA